MPAARDDKSLPRGRALHVPTEAVAKLVRADGYETRGIVTRVELVGLEPTASCMPCRRSAQLSYSPGEFILGGPV